MPSPSAPAASRWTSPSAGTSTADLRIGLSLFGGKGGVGKTTCAAAAALAAAESGRRVLALSTDPAHSLGDAFRVRLSAEPTPIPARRGTLLAAEIAAAPALARWRREHRQDLREIAARGTYLDEQDVERFLDLALPGADELMAWLEIDRLTHETGCDEVVVDAAPTAHTLRLLAMPEALRRFAEALDRMQDRHRLMAERFGGGWRPDASDALIASLETQGREIERRLRDPERCSLFWVMLPEALSLAETRDALALLDEAGLPVREVIVNRVMSGKDGEDCALCHARRAAEAEVIREIQATLGDRGLRFLPEEDREPRGKVALRRVARALVPTPASALTTPYPLLSPPPPRPPGEKGKEKAPDLFPTSVSSTNFSLFSRRTGGRRGEEGRGDEGLAWLDEIVPASLRLLFFGGKGGVGKTTCAASVALALAARRPEARVLLLSTDPAHSVADVLEVPLGDDERAVPGAPPGLRARELDPARAFAAWRDRHGQGVGEAVEAFSADGGGVGDLLDLTPPGLDELIALATLLDAVESAYDLVVVDTAPTGHALRLLEMPDLALSWDHYLLSLLLKYREAVALGDLAAELVELSRSLKRLEALLHDPGRARFVAVTRAAELPRRETLRLLDALDKLAIAVPAVIVNAVPPAGCARCAGTPAPAAGRLPYGRCAIMKAPALFPPPRGVRRLAEWAGTWEKAAK